VPSATATLRPPGAVPPPSRGVPAVPAFEPSSPFSSEKRAAAVTPIPPFAPPGKGFESVPAAKLPAFPSAPGLGAPQAPPAAEAAEAVTPSINEPAASAHALPPVASRLLSAGSAPIPAPSSPPLATTLDVVMQVPPEARPTPVEPIRALRSPLKSASEVTLPRDSRVTVGRIAIDSRTVVMVLSALCGALLVAVVGLYLAQNHGRTPERAPSASARPLARTRPPRQQRVVASPRPPR